MKAFCFILTSLIIAGSTAMSIEPITLQKNGISKKFTVVGGSETAINVVDSMNRAYIIQFDSLTGESRDTAKKAVARYQHEQNGTSDLLDIEWGYDPDKRYHLVLYPNNKGLFICKDRPDLDLALTWEAKDGRICFVFSTPDDKKYYRVWKGTYRDDVMKLEQLIGPANLPTAVTLAKRQHEKEIDNAAALAVAKAKKFVRGE